MKTYRFKAPMKMFGILRCVDVPAEISKGLGGGNFIRVRGTVSGVPMESTLIPKGNKTHRLFIHGRIWKKLGWVEGQIIEIKLMRNPDHANVEIPEDLDLELPEEGKQRDAWNQLTPALKREIVNYLNSAKGAETRAKRVSDLLGRLQQGKLRAKPRPKKEVSK